jgi:hypothetical protein
VNLDPSIVKEFDYDTVLAVEIFSQPTRSKERTICDVEVQGNLFELFG